MQQTTVRVRFAPSPTGLLHLGNARTALFNWLYAKKTGGTFILRIEDTDRSRSTDEYTNKLMEDLRWLGLAWDEGPDAGGPYGPYRQMERLDMYQEHLAKLVETGSAYKCYCTSEELDERRRIDVLHKRPPKYDNRCRNLTPEQIKQFEDEGRAFSYRFKVPDKKVAFDDIIRGHVEFDASLFGDFVIVKSDGVPTFHFAVVVDDALMKITHVLRGEDHLPNTPGHILIYEALGYAPPVYAHMSLTGGMSGEKFSKRKGAFSVDAFRKAGYLPEALVNYMALLGWSPKSDKETFRIEDVIKDFDLSDMNKSASRFDEVKLNFVNRYHIRHSAPERIVALARETGPFETGLPAQRELALAGVVQEHSDTLVDFVEKCLALINEPVITSQYREVLKKDASRAALQAVLEGVSKLPADFTEDDFEKMIKDAITASGRKGKAFYMPVRIALIGTEHGPEMGRLGVILGKDRVIGRLSKALEV